MALSLDNVVATLLNNVASLLPFRIVHDYEQAVRFTLGHAGPTIRGVEKGWHFFLPLIQRIQIVDATWGQVLFDAQSVETLDHKNLSISGAAVYRVVDARDYLLLVFDTDATATLRAIAKGTISSILAKETFAEIHAEKERMELAATEKLRNEVEGWGLEIRRIYFHDLVQTRNLRLHGLSQPPQTDNWE